MPGPKKGCTFYGLSDGTWQKLTDECEGHCTAPPPEEHQPGAVVFRECD
jgi:hypothetical protein